MDGILVVNKDINYTSRDVVNKLNSILKTKKIGHTGTLDPIASGVLVCPIGYYTKLSNVITDLDKEYVAEFIFGVKTDTLDITGNKLEESAKVITKEMLEDSLKHFTKTYEQEVPIYSAVKIEGKKLYEYAREGKDISLPTRTVHIKSIELISYENNKVKIKCEVSKGTYIRSLINDIGKYLGTYATMTSLVRTRQGRFKLDDAHTLEDIQNGNYKLLKLEDVLDLEIVDANDDLYKKVDNGVKLEKKYDKEFVLFKYNGDDIALYKKDENVYRMFIKIRKFS